IRRVWLPHQLKRRGKAPAATRLAVDALEIIANAIRENDGVAARPGRASKTVRSLGRQRTSATRGHPLPFSRPGRLSRDQVLVLSSGIRAQIQIGIVVSTQIEHVAARLAWEDITANALGVASRRIHRCFETRDIPDERCSS